jgi:hypothetical protein
VPRVALPHQIDLGRGRHLAEHQTPIQVGMILTNEHGVPLPVLAIAADRIGNGLALGLLASRPPPLDTLGHPLLLPDGPHCRVARATD